MCGIIAYIGSEPALPILLHGLKKLEPRGYDSRGISIFNTDTKEICFHKKAERLPTAKDAGFGISIDGFEQFKADLHQDFPGRIGIGHTRWKTHGEKTDVNAHPHASSDETIFVVHNGDIENYKELIQEYKLTGKLQSQTDTEVIPLLIEHFMSDLGISFTEAFLETLQRLRGAYGIAAISQSEPDRILVARCGSPIVIGKSNNPKQPGIFIASDQNAISNKVSEVTHLDDFEWGIIHEDGYNIKDIKTQSTKSKLPVPVEMHQEDDLDGFAHYMEKEIYLTPETIQKSINGRLIEEAGVYDVKLGGLESCAEELTNIDECILIGCGSASHAAKCIADMFEEYTPIRTRVYKSATFTDSDIKVYGKTIVIAISQSGQTKDTIDALKKAKKQGLTCIGIVNSPGSEIARITDAGVFNHIGPEISVASTKAVSSQIVIGALITVFIGERSGMRSRDKQAILSELGTLSSITTSMLRDHRDHIVSLAHQYMKFKKGSYIGSNKSTWLAEEAALKFREITYTDFFAFEASELKHGNIALVGDDYLCIAFAIQDSSLSKVRSNISQVRAAQGQVITITSDLETEGDIIPYNKEIVIFESLVANIQAQCFAYHFAKVLGLPIDKPRNLAKSVTVQ